MSVNKVVILGRLGADPEIRYTPSGVAVANFNMATTESWTDKSGTKQDRTEWHRIVVWGKLGELCNQYLSKGRQAFIEGKLQTRSWEGKDGSKRYTTEIVGSNVQFIGGANAGTGAGANSNTNSSSNNQQSNSGSDDSFMNQEYQVPVDSNFTADDIPF